MRTFLILRSIFPLRCLAFRGLIDLELYDVVSDIEYFSQAGLDTEHTQLKRNAPVAELYEDAVRYEGAIISSSGALINFSGKKTGRSPKDKRIVYEETSKDDIWWGPVNIKMDERTSLPLLFSLLEAEDGD
jgi:ATP-dependent phosphoenolpyruvate carboxykinase